MNRLMIEYFYAGYSDKTNEEATKLILNGLLLDRIVQEAGLQSAKTYACMYVYKAYSLLRLTS